MARRGMTTSRRPAIPGDQHIIRLRRSPAGEGDNPMRLTKAFGLAAIAAVAAMAFIGTSTAAAQHEVVL